MNGFYIRIAFVMAMACNLFTACGDDGSPCTDSINYCPYCRIAGEMCVGNVRVRIDCDIETDDKTCNIWSKYNLVAEQDCEDGFRCIDNALPNCTDFSETGAYSCINVTLKANCIKAEDIPASEEEICEWFDSM